MTIKKPTLLTGKYSNNLGTVGKMIFSITTYDRTHGTSFSKILIRHLLFSEILPVLANNDIPLKGIMYAAKYSPKYKIFSTAHIVLIPH